MTPEMFSRAKKEFIRLIDINERERAAALKSLRRSDSELAKEVLSLLDNHFSKTIIKSDSVTANAANDSTSSRTRSHSLQKLGYKLLSGFLPITTAILASAVLAGLGWGLQSILQNRIAASKASHLTTLADLQQGLLDQWHRAVSLKVESWVRSTAVRKAIVELVEASRDTTLDPAGLQEKLLSSPSQAVIEREINVFSGIPWVNGDTPPDTSQRYTVRVADPGGSIFDDFVPKDPLQEWPRTAAARVALYKRSGIDMGGYRDFVGRKVVGRWRWDERLQAAIVIEQTTSEAFQTIRFVDIVNRIAWGIPFSIAIGLAKSSGIRTSMRRGKQPARIGAYNVVGNIGEGGLGVVYKAEHRLLGRVIAIKLLKSTSINRQDAKRFEREVRLASRLVHPNAVNIYDYGLSQEGYFYYAMEYIHGVNLTEFVTYAKQIPIDRSLHTLIQICGAIREAHLEGLIHRDIKPQNVMIYNRGGIADVVKVLDYGLVKSFATQLSSNETETSVLMGTPKFMAPERLETPWLADPRIDIFSIGTVAYYLLMGHTPVLDMTSDGMLNLMASEQSPYRELAGQKAFQELIRLIGFCVSPDPLLRPGSVGAIIDVLQTISLTYPWQQTTAEAWCLEHESDLLENATNQREGKMQLQPLEIIKEARKEKV